MDERVYIGADLAVRAAGTAKTTSQDSTYPFKAARSRVRSSHGQPFSRAHFSTSRWPPFARVRARQLVPRAVVLAQPLQRLEVAALRRARARPIVPRAVVRARPLQHLEVAALRRVRARRLVPRAAVLARPLQHLEVAALRRVRARPLVPRAAVLARPLQHLEVAALRQHAHVLIPTQPFSRAHQHVSASRTSPRPTGSRSRAPTSAPRGGRPPPRSRTSTRPTGSRSRAPTSASRGGRAPPRSRTCTRPTGSRSRAPTSAPRGGRPPPPSHVASRPTGSRSRAPTSAPRGGRPRRGRARPLVPRAAVRARPLQHLEVAALRRPRARQLVPRAAVLARPLQHLEVAARRRPRARQLVPRAVVLARPLQHLELSALRRCAAQAPLVIRTPRVCLSFSKLRYPRRAACQSGTTFISRPVASTASRILRLTARSRPRSPGSGRKSDLRMCVEITSRGRLEKPPGASAVSTAVSWCCFDVSEVIVDGEVRVVSVSCVVRACVCAATRSEVEAFNFSSDVTTTGDVTCLRYHVRFETTRGPVYHGRS